MPWDIKWNFGPLFLFALTAILIFSYGWESQGWGWCLFLGFIFWRTPKTDDDGKDIES